MIPLYSNHKTEKREKSKSVDVHMSASTKQQYEQKETTTFMNATHKEMQHD